MDSLLIPRPAARLTTLPKPSVLRSMELQQSPWLTCQTDFKLMPTKTVLRRAISRRMAVIHSVDQNSERRQQTDRVPSLQRRLRGRMRTLPVLILNRMVMLEPQSPPRLVISLRRRWMCREKLLQWMVTVIRMLLLLLLLLRQRARKLDVKAEEKKPWHPSVS